MLFWIVTDQHKIKRLLIITSGYWMHYIEAMEVTSIQQIDIRALMDGGLSCP